ncbi:hypothetical protein C8Q80DRAFT_1218314 [Daedaleopsis nitida]|nr:hypothetical protein C8Q80DRAFT_1218314 [Daedaleopsis nitida]
MEYTNAAWLQPSPIADLQSVHDERSSNTTDDWKEQGASVHGGGINDLFGDIQVSGTPLPAANSPGTTFFLPLVYTPTSAPYNAVQYGASAWPSTSTQQLPLSSYSSLNGATSTSSHGQSQSPPSNAMVIDPALTMNGSAASPPQQFQQSAFLSSQPQSRMQYQYPQQSHSPALSINPAYVHSNPQHYQQQPQHHMSLPRHHSHSPPQPQQQGTLSPFVLHSPTSNFYAGISPSSFYGAPPPQPQAGPSSAPHASTSHASQPTTVPTPPNSTPSASSAPSPAPTPKVSPEQRRVDLNRGVKPLIQPTSFTGAGAVSQLVNIIDDYGIPEVETATRLDILTKIRDNAGNHYFRAWVDNPVAMEIIREWLKLAFVGRAEPQLAETIMPILHIIDRLPMNLDKLKASKLGKLIMRLVKDPPSPAIQDMASNLERKWRKMLTSEPDKMDTENTEDTKGKKRRADSATAKGAPPVKKVAAPGPNATAPKAVAVKKEAKSVVKDAKSDSSFFSKPKPTKKEMPSFKKNPPAPPAAVKKEPDLNVAQPSSFNPFEEVLKSYGSGAGAGSSAASTSTPPPGSSVAAPSAIANNPPAPGALGFNKAGKPRKSVTWAPDGKLEQVKLIERAIYDDDPAAGSHPTHNLRDLDRDEGAALHAHLFDEQIEWAEPQPLEMPPDVAPRGGQSQERVAQEEREQSALVVLYSTPAQIPDSPAEPAMQIPEEHVDEGVCIMLTGPDVDAVFWSGGEPAIVDTVRPSASVAELVGQLAAAAPDVMMGDATHAAAAMPSLFQAFSGINPEQLQQLVQQAQALTQSAFSSLGPTAGPPPQAGDPGWGPGNQYSEYDRGYHENGVGRGGGDPSRRWNEENWAGTGPSGGDRGGPGPGRGRGLMGRGGPGRGVGRGRGDGFRSIKRKPCSFFLAGRCRYGDQCDFSHDPVLPY